MAVAKKTKDEAAPVNESAPPAEGNVFLEAIDALDLSHVCEALKRYTKHAYVAGNDYECGQLTRLTQALETRVKVA